MNSFFEFTSAEERSRFEAFHVSYKEENPSSLWELRGSLDSTVLVSSHMTQEELNLARREFTDMQVFEDFPLTHM